MLLSPFEDLALCVAVVELLLPQYIGVPTGDRLHDVVAGFSCRWGFSQCVGAIDGTLIPVVAPKENAPD